MTWLPGTRGSSARSKVAAECRVAWKCQAQQMLSLLPKTWPQWSMQRRAPSLQQEDGLSKTLAGYLLTYGR